MKQILVLSLLIFLCSGGLAQPRPPRRPPGQPPVQEAPTPGVPQESEFFGGGTVSYDSERPSWSRLGTKPIIIGLAKGRDWNMMELVIEYQLRKFASTLTRNVLTIHEDPWNAKNKFKQLASGDNRFCWLWLEAKVESLSLAWFHCWNLVCFGGSQARISIMMLEINPYADLNRPVKDQEWLVAASSSHFIGHIHAWGTRKWLEAGAPYNRYYFIAGALLQYQIEFSFAPYLSKKLR